MKSMLKISVITGLALGLMLSLSGCRDEEQNRVLMYKKGQYLGAPDSGLSEEGLNRLVQRSRLQSGV